MRPQLIRLTPEYNIKPFDCEDADLNGFLLETDHTIPNARHHAIELLAVTYLIEDLDADETIAYFSLLNDKIERDITDTTAWNRLSRQLPNIKRRSSHPSVKRTGELWIAEFTEESAHRYYLERLLPHEVGHCADYNRGLLNTRSSYKEENSADNYAYGHNQDE